MDEAVLAELRDAQLAYLRSWLTSDAARTAWIARAEQAEATLRSARLVDLIDRDALLGALDAMLDAPATLEVLRAATARLAREVMTRVSVRPERPAALVGDEALEKLQELAGRPEVVSRRLLEAVLKDPTVESAMREVLYDALTEFNRKVNPFFADWGLPALLDSIPLFGKGAVRQALDGLRKDFDKRLEPEIRRFLEGFARRSMDRTVQQMMDRGGDPELVALRQHLVTALMEQPLSELCWAPDTEHGALAIDVAALATRDVLSHRLVRQQVMEAVDAELDNHGDETFGEWLDARGIGTIDLGPLADAAWPALRVALSTDPVFEQIGALIDAANAAWLAGRNA